MTRNPPQCWRAVTGCAPFLIVLLAVSSATAAPPPEPPAATEAASPPDPATERGRQAFLKGVKLSKDTQWGDALVAFEEAAAARDAPIVQFNIAYCQRALGRYVAARETTRKVLADPTGLAPLQIEDAKAYLAEFEQVIVEARVTLDPPAALLTVDGRPLLPSKDKSDTFYASIAPPGEGGSPGKSEFTVMLDPGAHMFRAVRPGHQDAMVQKSYRAGEKPRLDLHLDILPAVVSVKANLKSAIVRIDKREVGIAPIEIQRPAGRYTLEVERENFLTYTATLDLRPGQRSDLTAKLLREPITKKKWFVPAVVGGVLALGGAIFGITYALTRPEPVPPPYDGGTTGWVLEPAGMRF